MNYNQGTIMLRTICTYVDLVSALQNSQPDLR